MKIFDFNKLADTVSAYLETRIELLKLDLKEQSARLLSKILTWGMMLVALFSTMLFLSVGLASFLNQVLNSPFWGYIIVAGGYLLIGLGIFLSRAFIEEKLHVQVKESDILEEESGEEDEQ